MEQSKNNSAALGQGPGSSSRNICNNTFEFFCKTKKKNETNESQGGGLLEPVLEPLNSNCEEECKLHPP